MLKNSTDGIGCRICNKPPVPDTYPPLCAECARLHKTAQNTKPRTLQELEDYKPGSAQKKD